MENKIPIYLLRTGDDQYKPALAEKPDLSFLNITLMKVARAVISIYMQAENATKEGSINKIHPQVKFISLIFFEIVISLANNHAAQLLISAFIFLIYIVARLKLIHVYRKIFFLAFIFGFLVIFPASLNVITPGKIVFNLFTLDHPLHFWIYNIPQNIGITEDGIRVVILFFLRVLNSVSFALLIVYTTSFPAFVKSFKILGVPDTFQMIISLAYKYIFILCQTAEETFFALKSRLISNMKNSRIRKMLSGLIFYIFKKSMYNYENTYYAMVSRGYRGKVVLRSRGKFLKKDFIALIIIVAFGIAILLI